MTAETQTETSGSILASYLRYRCSLEKLNAITQRDIARKCSVSQQTASKLLRGIGWKDSYIDKISEFLQMTPPTFFNSAYRYHYAIQRHTKGDPQPIDPTPTPHP